MRIALDPSGTLVATLFRGGLRVHDVAADEPRMVTAVGVEQAREIARGGPGVAVLAGRVAPAKASLRGAKLLRYSWALGALGECALGEVARYDLSLDAAGARAVTTDWKTGYVTVYDAATGARLGANGRGWLSGATFSPDGALAIAGSADQGSGEILLFEVAAPTPPTLSMVALPEPRPSPGLDDAKYSSAWSRDGARAALSNETWGGRGVFVYDPGARKPVWSVVLDGTSEESDEWFAYPVAFAAGDRVLLVGGPEVLRAYDAADGRALGAVPMPGDGRGGFVVDEARWIAWTPGPLPVAHALPEAWREARPIEAPPAKMKKGPTKKR